MAEIFHVLLIEDARVNISRETMIGISEYVRVTGNWMIDKDISYYSPSMVINANLLHKRHLEGVICLNPSDERMPLIEECIDRGIPVLARGTNKSIPGAINIVSNNDLIADMSAEHLLGLGLRHFAFFGYSGMPWSQRRRDSFRKQVEQTGYDLHEFEFLPMQEDIDSDRHSARIGEWLTSLPKPIGIMACNDDFGLILLQCCRLCGIQVPREIAVIGVDNSESTCHLCVPPLSSIARDAQKAGFEAARLLDRRMMGESIEYFEVMVNATHVVKRQSTDILAIEDEYVRKAFEHIDRNILDNPSVEDVLAEVMISRRNLDDRFRRNLDRTVFEVITQKRMSKICDMLNNTDMTATEIAYSCNFNDLAQMCGYFQRHKGISPGRYRNISRIGKNQT